uniref:Uncharacterized protein n=1 Tax=Anguilla anguilla TaxID=7936 RepID=A0A0E9Y0M8_ANGAN
MPNHSLCPKVTQNETNQKTAEYSERTRDECRMPDLDAGFRCPLPTVAKLLLSKLPKN